jgi:signal transduction histidine kinase
VAERSAPRRILASTWLDPALAVGFALISVSALYLGPNPPDSPLAPLLLVVLCGTLVFRRTHPLPAAAVGAAALLMAVAVDLEGDSASVGAFPVMFILSYSCGAHASLRGGLLGVVGLLIGAQAEQGFADFPNVELVLGTLAPWWVGREVRTRRELVAALEERTRELEREQDSFVRLSVRRERARIARELHDIVAHHVAVIVVQAGAGRLAGGENGTAVGERFASIRQSGGQALAEMSLLVDIINADSGDDRDGSSRLRALVEDAQAAGLEVDVTPFPGDVAAEIEDDALRIVQEGLTNALKHAPGARVEVRFGIAGDALEIEVRDHGGGTQSVLAQTGAALGLSGMRERIESLGGSFEAGPSAEGGWRLCARLPGVAGPLSRSR